VGDKWASLTPEERAPYNEAAARDRERYEQELRDYHARFPQVCNPAVSTCWALVAHRSNSARCH
jgi:hypothetical protein